ncbi:MAG: isocitrate/isopropylmalate dehydrogenase family protein [Anaerolineae bacterium]|nr:isocitrate/isopropylmalate dehydrogenase family protein [Thermoflexales bacterium]MDW8408099.1 isocitrate/isopropylmalate dehydrogenase family protein [Anaerolineae bacterium]
MSMFNLCVIPGDGAGREVVPCAVEVLQRVLPDVKLIEADAGWDCFTRTGYALPQATIERIETCGAALFGAVSSPSRKVPGYRSPIVHMRQHFDLYANLRPTRALPSNGVRPNGVQLNGVQSNGARGEPPMHDSPRSSVDLVIVRENTQGLYAGREYMRGDEAIAERVITRAASMRIGQVAFELAARRARKQLTIVHKANILSLTDGVFRDAVREVGASYPEVSINEVLVDTAAMLLASKPEQFDVIVTTNLFGDILSDVASVWGGGMGVAPALNLGASVAIAEPVHGSAPDIAGKGIANPSGAILSVALLLRYHWNRPAEAERIEQAVYSAIAAGCRTPDLGGRATTREMTEAVLAGMSA